MGSCEAPAAVLDLDFDQLMCEKVEADVFAHNERGWRLLERMGMKREGVIRHAFRKYGEWVDVAVYGMVAAERSPE